MQLKKSNLLPNITIEISGSKSISNRLLILNKLFDHILIHNLSNSQDTQLIREALDSSSEVIDIHHAGTAMRFLTSYFAIQNPTGRGERRTVILTGSPRMKNRPIGFLVDALRELGGDITYLENQGYPPLKIVSKTLTKNSVQIPAHISSQFITSLLLIAGKLENGLEIELVGDIVSRSYLDMTLKMITELEIKNEWKNNVIKIFPFSEKKFGSRLKSFEVESDWSSASYYYSLVAIGKKNINLKSFRCQSLQGDSIIKEIYWDCFGVNTISDGMENKISLLPSTDFQYPDCIELNLNNCPDIAQTICVTAAALKIPFFIKGLSTLKVKETDRLTALKNELLKIGCKTEITENSIKSIAFLEPEDQISITTYQDHRMAMSFAPYCLIKEIAIEDSQVVEKSYPNFWEDIATILIDE